VNLPAPVERDNRDGMRWPAPASRSPWRALFRNPNLPVRAGETPREAPRADRPADRQKETTGRAPGSHRGSRPFPSVPASRTKRAFLTDLIDLTDPIEATARSAPNSVRLRDTSPSSCRENPSPSISAWLRPRPHTGRKDLPPQRQISRHRRFQRFLPAMSHSFAEAVQAAGEGSLWKRLPPPAIRWAKTESSGWDREQKRLHEMNVAAVFGGEAAEEEEEAKSMSTKGVTTWTETGRTFRRIPIPRSLHRPCRL